MWVRGEGRWCACALQDGGGMYVSAGVMTLEGCSIYDNTAASVRAHACAASPFALGLGAPPSGLPPAPPASVAHALPRFARSRRARVPAARCVHMRPALGWIAGVVRVQRPLRRWWRGEEGAVVHWAAWAEGVVCEVGGPRWVVLDVGCAGGGRGAIRVGIAPGGVCGGLARSGGVRPRCRTEQALPVLMVSPACF